MHLTAVVSILVVTGIAKGNLSFRSACWDKEIWISSKHKLFRFFFIWTDFLCVEGKYKGWIFYWCKCFMCLFDFWCKHAAVPFFLSQRLGMQRRVQHRKWVLWEAREVQVLKPPQILVCIIHHVLWAFATFFFFLNGAVNVPPSEKCNHNPASWIPLFFLDLWGACTVLRARSALCLNSKNHCYPNW